MQELAEDKPRRGNPAWQGKSGNPAGRPKVLDKDKKTNRELRNESLLHLCRRLKPHISKAVMAAATMLSDEKASESGKLRAAALLITTYQGLIKDVYDLKYADEEGEEMQQSSAPVYSLRVLTNTEE